MCESLKEQFGTCRTLRRNGLCSATSHACQPAALTFMGHLMQTEYLLRKGNLAAKIDPSTGSDAISAGIKKYTGDIALCPNSKWRSQVADNYNIGIILLVSCSSASFRQLVQA